MAIISTISPKELQRQASLVFEGKTLKVMLCLLTEEGTDINSTVEDWQAVEVTAGGYVRGSAVVETGSYNSTTGSYDIPDITISFTATEPYNYNVMVLYFDGEDYIHSIIQEVPNIALFTGQVQSYIIRLKQDD